MITSLDDYLFVTGANVDADHPHGDLDRIIIDGDIMPLRTGTTATGVDRKKLLRGEDLAFLMEAVNERMEIILGSSSGHGTGIFYRKVMSALPRNCCAAMRDVISSWLRAEPDEQFSLSADPVLDYRTASELESSPDDFASDESLPQASISKMFRDLKLMTVTRKIATWNPPQTYTDYDLTSLDADYPYTPSSVMRIRHLSYQSAGPQSPTASHPNRYAGRTWLGRTQFPDFSLSLSAAVGSVEFWVGATTEYIAEDGSTTYFRDFFKCGSGSSSDGKTWTMPIGLSGAKAIAMKAWQKHLDDGEIQHVPEYQVPQKGEGFAIGMTISAVYAVITLGDHTKWWDD